MNPGDLVQILNVRLDSKWHGESQVGFTGNGFTHRIFQEIDYEDWQHGGMEALLRNESSK